MNTETQIIGYIAGMLLVINPIPQIYRTLKTKKAEDISIYFLILQMLTCIFFLTYGILLTESPIIIANSIVLFELIILISIRYLFSFKNNIESTLDKL